MTRPRMLKDQNYNSIPGFYGVRQSFSKTMGVAASPVSVTFSPADNAGYTDQDEDGQTLLMEPNQIYELSLNKNIVGAPAAPSQINIYTGKTSGVFLTNPFFVTVFRDSVFITIKLHSDQDRIKVERIGTVVEDLVIGIRKLS